MIIKVSRQKNGGFSGKLKKMKIIYVRNLDGQHFRLKADYRVDKGVSLVQFFEGCAVELANDIRVSKAVMFEMGPLASQSTLTMSFLILKLINVMVKEVMTTMVMEVVVPALTEEEGSIRNIPPARPTDQASRLGQHR